MGWARRGSHLYTVGPEGVMQISLLDGSQELFSPGSFVPASDLWSAEPIFATSQRLVVWGRDRSVMAIDEAGVASIVWGPTPGTLPRMAVAGERLFLATDSVVEVALDTLEQRAISVGSGATGLLSIDADADFV